MIAAAIDIFSLVSAGATAVRAVPVLNFCSNCRLSSSPPFCVHFLRLLLCGDINCALFFLERRHGCFCQVAAAEVRTALVFQRPFFSYVKMLQLVLL